jgi:type I restriction enzyme M protein
LARYRDGGEQGRFRRFSRDWIAERNDNLDISWLKDERDAENGELPEPAILAQEAMGALEAAILELQGILKELGEEVSVMDKELELCKALH